MDIIKLVCDKQKIKGLDPNDIMLAISEYKCGMINPTDWKVQSVTRNDGITLFNESTYDVKYIDCVLNNFCLGKARSCATLKGYFNIPSSADCADCINKVLNDYLNGRIKKKTNKKGN